MRSSTLLLLPFAVTGSLAQITWDTAFPTSTSSSQATINYAPRRNAPLFAREPYRCQNGGELACCDYVGGRDTPCHNRKQASVPSECTYVACCLTKGHGYYCLDPKEQAAAQAQQPAPTYQPAPAPVSQPAPQQPSTVAQPDPPVVAQPDPPVIAQPDPPAAQPNPPVVAQPDPPVVAQPDPPVVAQPDPPVVAQPDPPAATAANPQPINSDGSVGK